MKKLLSLISALLISLYLLAQKKSTIDSLQNIVDGKYHDTLKISALNNLGMNYYLFDLNKAKVFWEKQLELINNTNYKAKNKTEKYFYNSSKGNAFGCIAFVYQSWGDLDSAIIFSDSSITISKKIGDMQTLASILNNLGVIYNYKGDIVNALKCYEKSYKIQDSLGIGNGVAMALNNIALIYKSQGDIPKALDYHIKSLKISEKIKDAFSMGHAYNNIGIIYRDNGEFKKGMEYFHKSYDIRKTINDLNGMALALNEIGVGFSQTQQYDSAYNYHKQSLELREKLGDSTYIAQSLVNIGIIFSRKKLYNQSLEYFNKALAIKITTQEQQGIADAYGHIGGTYYLMKQYDKAEENSSKALIIAQQLKFPSEIERACEKLSLIYSEQGKYKQAYQMHLLFKQMSDSIFNENNRKETFKQQIKYDFDKKAFADSVIYENNLKIKDLELAKKEEQTKKHKVIIYSFVLGFFLILIFAIIIYRLFIQKKKANIQLEIKNVEILQKNEEITTQRDEIEAQRDEITKHRDIILDQKNNIEDSINYAKRIQEAVLPDLEFLNLGFRDSREFEIQENSNFLNSKFFILFRPKDIVSGDFYWTAKIENTLIVAVADCTGHGVPGAFMSMLGISFLNEIVRKKEITKANEVLNQLRKEIINALQQKGQLGEQKDGMDMALAVINIETNELQSAGANNPLWIIRNNLDFPNFQNLENLIELKPDKMPIAIYEKMDSFTNHELQLNSGDILYLMSDGYQDQFGGPKFKKFLSKNLKQLLIANCQLPMNEQKNILDKTLVEWIGDGEQIDDITVLGIKII